MIRSKKKVVYNPNKKSGLKFNNRNLATLIMITGLILIVVLLVFSKTNNKNSLKTSSVQSSENEEVTIKQESREISVDLAAVGDMLPHETVTKAASTSSGGYDYLSLISPKLQDSFKKSDVRFCNQEAPSAAALGIRGYPAFNAPADFPKSLSEFGCNIISVGNNHSSDGGQAGINGTLQEWNTLSPLAVSGSNRSQAEADKLQIFEKNGIKIGFVAFSQDSNAAQPSSYSVNRLSNTKLLESQIKELRKEADVVIVSAHWGTEDSHNVNALQNKYAQQISDFGADIIIGSGPHVWQPYKDLKGVDGNTTHTWFSIGNGLNSQTKVDQLFSGVALQKISKSKDGVITIDSPRVLPTYMHYVWTNGIGFNNAQLLARDKLKWLRLDEGEAEELISNRNDFKTTKQAQIDKLKSYLQNDKVTILESY